MNKISIEFSGHVPLSRKLGWGIFAAGVLSLALVIWRHADVKVELESASKTHQLLAAELQERSILAVPKVEADNQEKNVLGGAKSIPWEELFRALEQAAGEDIALLEFEPDAQEWEIRIVGEARNLEAMLAYLKRLQNTSIVAEVRLVSHQEQVQDPQRPVRFEIDAAWRQAAERRVVNSAKVQCRSLEANECTG